MKWIIDKFPVLFFLLCLAIIFFLAAPSWAGDDDHGHHDGGASTTSVDVAGSTLDTSNKTFALAGGDMDIRDCLATHSILFGLWQGTHINPLCEAQRLNAVGKYQAAAELKCSLWKFKRVYGKDCINAVILSTPEIIETPVMVEETDDDDDYRDEQIEQQQIMIADLQMQFDTLEARRQQARARPAPSVVQQQTYSDDQRAEVFKILGIDEGSENGQD